MRKENINRSSSIPGGGSRTFHPRNVHEAMGFKKGLVPPRRLPAKISQNESFLAWIRRVLWERLCSRTTQLLIDASIVALSLAIAYWIRFEGDIPEPDKNKLLSLLPYVVLLRILANYLLGVYSLVWRYVSLSDIPIMLKPIGACSLIFLSLRLFLPPDYAQYKLPLSVISVEFLLVFLGFLGARVLRRILYERASRRVAGGCEKRVLLVGAGLGGIMAVREVERNRGLGLKIVGFVDDNQKKVNTVIAGIKVLGTTANLEQLVHRLAIEEVIITIALASRKDIRRIVKICEAVPVKVKIIPGLYEILSGSVSVSKFREVRIEDLLGRDVVEFDNEAPEVQERFSGKRILITGAGGSIGSELCRQILRLHPQELILLDKDENSLFEIDAELRGLALCQITAVIADIRDQSHLKDIFQRHLPQVIFHAAAYKHVPLMELNPAEAILNNVIGTKHLVDLVDPYAVETFVMLSTDKAVNPANIMGASKRLAEMIVQTKALGSKTRLSCVRFGNVLGSRGSVVPIFQKQIAKGGPVTVTHPEVTRYFMTIPEAVYLVIQAGSLGRSGEIFILDMGEPVRIVDLAKDLIHLSGLKVGEDIDIEFIGLRPGEKLHEELLIGGEAKATKFKKIFIESPTKIETQKLQEAIQELRQAAELNDPVKIYTILDTWFNGNLRRIGSSEWPLKSGEVVVPESTGVRP